MQVPVYSSECFPDSPERTACRKKAATSPANTNPAARNEMNPASAPHRPAPRPSASTQTRISYPPAECPRVSACSAACCTALRLDVPQLLRRFSTHQRHHLIERDVLIVRPAKTFRRRREDRPAQPVSLPQSRLDLHSAYHPRRHIILPARPRQISAHHALNRIHLRPRHQHRPVLQILAVLPNFLWKFLYVRSHHMVRNNVLQIDRTRTATAASE